MAVLSEQAVADELAIRNLTAAYSDAVTRRDREVFASLWADDGVWVVPGLADTVGGAAAADQLLTIVEGMSWLVQMLQGGQVWVDGDRARARWTIVERGQLQDGRGMHIVGIYQDEHVRTEAGWRFARRHFEFLYRGFVEMGGKAYPVPELDW